MLVACEFSGVVRRAFRERGHDAWSCDILPAEDGSAFHFQRDMAGIWKNTHAWDLLIAHPPCTYLAVSGARWWKERRMEQSAALGFVRALLNAPVPRIALENPIGVISTRIRKPDQIVQPWQFGHGETKATCLWLKDLPKLVPTDIVDGRTPRVHYASPGAAPLLRLRRERPLRGHVHPRPGRPAGRPCGGLRALPGGAAGRDGVHVLGDRGLPL